MINSTMVRTTLGGLMLLAVSSTAHACPAVPTAIRDLDIPRYYSDAAGTVIDPRLKAQYDATVAPLVGFLREVANEADAALKSAKPDKRQEAAQCALSWIEAWARGRAWLGARITQQGEYQRKWDLGGVALAYIKVRGQATAEQRRVIEPWLMQVADAARAFFDNRDRKRNNHWYWLGLGLGGVAIATGQEKYWVEARRIAQDAARDIRADGALPMELDRAERGLHYHAFSVMPLVVLAEIAAARGEDFYAFSNGALHRLVSLSVAGLAEPTSFEKIAGTRQLLTPSSAGAAWLPLYRERFPGKIGAVPLAMRSADRRLGGDVTLLLRHLQERQQPAVR